jgi:hypothetical protein
MMSTTTTLPTLAAADAERLSREAAAYLVLVDAFRTAGVEPAWGIANAAPEAGCSPATPDDVDETHGVV